MYGAVGEAQWTAMMAERVPWLTTVLGVVATASLIAIVAFGLPDGMKVSLARITGMPRFLPPAATTVLRVQASRWAQDIAVLPAAVREPLPDTDAVSRLETLRARPPLLIETATLIIPPGVTSTRIVAPTLTLRDVTIVTNGAPLEIETETLDVTNTSIRSFPAGSEEASGRDGGTVRIIVRGAMRGVLGVDLSGQPGKPGMAGAAGAPGLPGTPGAAARSGKTECISPAGQGGDGKPGGAGSPGGNGDAGGKGGTLDLTATDPVAIAVQVQFAAPGGAGGLGGPGGVAGKGGSGGPGGDPAGVCFGNGPAGKDGPAGMPGPAGAPGPAGEEGALHVHDFSER